MAPKSALVATFTGNPERNRPSATPSSITEAISAKYEEISWAEAPRKNFCPWRCSTCTTSASCGSSSSISKCSRMSRDSFATAPGSAAMDLARLATRVCVAGPPRPSNTRPPSGGLFEQPRHEPAEPLELVGGDVDEDED